MKQALKKTLGRQLLPLHQMITLITEIEAVINSRPLTFVYSDFESGFALTPSHFLTMRHRLSCPTPWTPTLNSTLPPLPLHVVDHCRQSQRCLDVFWTICHKEYTFSVFENVYLFITATTDAFAQTQTSEKWSCIIQLPGILAESMPSSLVQMVK